MYTFTISPVYICANKANKSSTFLPSVCKTDRRMKSHGKLYFTYIAHEIKLT